MADEETYAANWYPDPFLRAELRYYDGAKWTEHISTKGETLVDPFGANPSVTGGVKDYVVASGLKDYIMDGANAANFTDSRPQWTGTGHLFTEPVLVVKQQGSGMLSTSSNYNVEGHDGVRLGSVREVGQSQAKQVFRALTNFDKHLKQQFEVLDADDNVMLKLVRPANWMKSKIEISDAADNLIGVVKQKNTYGSIDFTLEVDGRKIGRIKGQDWGSHEFTIHDESGAEIGKITKAFEGLRQVFKTGTDSYVVVMHRPLEDPLRLLVVASGVCIDTALHPEERRSIL
ncbi:MAG: phospholipid scramblase-related protein [Acidimicrobiia bacterium]